MTVSAKVRVESSGNRQQNEQTVEQNLLLDLLSRVLDFMRREILSTRNITYSLYFTTPQNKSAGTQAARQWFMAFITSSVVLTRLFELSLPFTVSSYGRGELALSMRKAYFSDNQFDEQHLLLGVRPLYFTGNLSST